MEPAEPDPKGIKGRQTVWMAYLQTQARPGGVVRGRSMPMGEGKENAQAWSKPCHVLYLQPEMLHFQELFF